MAQKLALVAGIPRMVDESASPTIYDDYLLVVASDASGENEINLADAQSVDNITLPNSGEYSGDELEVYLNNIRLHYLFDYTYVGSGTRTQVSINFDLEVNDILRFRVDRGA